MTKKILTLCVIHQPPRILLGLKKRGFGAGKWNGFGGKVEAGETIEEAAIREVFEEIGVRINGLEKFGVLDFTFKNDTDDLEVHVFGVTEFEGEPEETEEMTPAWFDFDSIPYKKMWADDVHWLPLFLAGKKFKARFDYDDFDTILNHSIELK
jgi:8-oxo-dGTP diphosphatase / 2-hydroxy-dATP diphosphatase